MRTILASGFFPLPGVDLGGTTVKMFLDGFSITKNQGPGVCEQILVKASVEV